MSAADLGSFTYSSQPHSAPVKTTRKYRDSPGNIPDEASLTLMSDPRVVRGSTFSLARKIAKAKSEFSKSQTALQQRTANNIANSSPSRPSYRYDVKPFSNEEIDVSQYLIQQNESSVLTKTADNQTDEFVPRPPSPDYIPAKIGVDVGTQVDDVGELFDFDKEVVPILEVIVQKTQEQALFEVQSEEELIRLEEAAVQFRTEKFNEEEWVKLREEQAIKDNANTRNHILALQNAREAEVRTKTAVAGVQMMKQILPHAFDSIVAENLSRGVWQTPEAAAAEGEVIPSLLAGGAARTVAIASAQEVLDDLLLGAEALYHTFPTYTVRGEGQPTMTVTFRGPAPESDGGDGDGGDGEDSGAAPTSAGPSAPASFTSLAVLIGPQDSIISLEKTIRAGVLKLRASAAGGTATAGEGGEESTEEQAAAPAAPSMILPDSAALGELRGLLTERVLDALHQSHPLPAGIARDLPHDAILWNFPLPAQIDVNMVVGGA